MTPLPVSPIATRLASRIFVWATLCALFIGAVQVVVSYRHVQDEFEAAVREIGNTHVPLLSVSIWDIEPDAVRRQIGQLAAMRDIGYVRLTVSTGQVFEAGYAHLAESAQLRSFDIPPPQRPEGVIGKLEVVADPAAFYREIVYSLGPTIIGYGVLTLTICGLIVFILKRELAQPLHAVARFVTNLTPDKLTTPLTLSRPANHRRDEIDLVVDGFRVLQEGINGHIANLDHLVALRTEELESALESIRQLSLIDPLTGCFNRRSFDERLAREIERAERYNRPLALVFADIDHFKAINDTYGHLVGDQVLRAVAESFCAGLRTDVDWMARYGGEEFVVVLPETMLHGAVAIAERLREAVQATAAYPDFPSLRITASFGVAAYGQRECAEDLIRRADASLYAAKQAGRNRTMPALTEAPV